MIQISASIFESACAFALSSADAMQILKKMNNKLKYICTEPLNSVYSLRNKACSKLELTR